MKYFRSLLILFLFFVSGCSLLSPKAEYIPNNEKLPEAIVGKPYFMKISIVGGRVFGGTQRNAGTMVPGDTGISIRNCRLPDSVITSGTRDFMNHNCVEIYGVPTKAGAVKINIGGGMYGSMIAPASYFSKNYTLSVMDHNSDL